MSVQLDDIPKLISRKDLALRLGKKERTIRMWTEKGICDGTKLSKVIIGNTIKYDLNEVNNFLLLTQKRKRRRGGR